MSKRKQDKIYPKAKDVRSDPLAHPPPMAGPVSILEAAKSLNVSQRTVWNYIRKGRLDKVTIGHKVYVSPGSIERFAQSEKQPSFPERPMQKPPADETVALLSGKALVEVSHLEDLLTRLGQIKAENQHLLQSQADQKNGNEELADAKARLVELQTKQSEARSRVLILEKENKYIRTMLWIMVAVGLSLVIGTVSLLLK